MEPAAAFPEPGNLLFAYGTLMRETGFADVDAAMRDAGVILGRGYIHGRLYDLGEYPGAVPAEGTEEAEPSKVWGRLIHLKDPAALFAVLDPYEGFEAADPAGSEFVRSVVRVMLPDAGGSALSQVYFYTFPTRGRERIVSGDWLT